MYHVLIAEDKSLIRKGIISMIEWSQLDCCLIGEAANGQDAIRMIQELKPDILITDIKMPHVDGLKLMDYVHENHLPTQIIVISGYDDFSFVRHALCTACVDYILKPISKEDLNKSLQRAIELLQKHTSMESSEDTPTSKELTNCILNMSEAIFSDVFNGLRKNCVFCVICLWNRNHEYTNTLYNLKSCIPNDLQVEYAHLQRTIVLIMEVRSICDAVTFSNALMSQTFHGEESFCGISRLYCAMNSILEAYQEALSSLNSKFLHPNQHIFLAKDLDRNQCKNHDSINETALMDQLLFGNHDVAISIVHQFLNVNMADNSLSLEEFRLISMRILSLILKASNACSLEINTLMTKLTSAEHLLELESTHEIFTAIDQIIVSTCSEFKKMSTKNPEAIKNYINIHFMEHLSLSMLSEVFHFNQSYLSSLFKRQYGIGINKYITTLRLEYACQLLNATDLSIIEIYQRSGYQSYIHFLKAFKLAKGVPPGEYRRLKFCDENGKNPKQLN